MLVLDSGALTKLARRTRQNAALLAVLRSEGLWPAIVPSVVVVESTTGRSGPDATTNRLLTTCDVVTELPESTARRAASLRFQARRGSAVDAIVVASAEPGGAVMTGDVDDLDALASHAADVTIQRV